MSRRIHPQRTRDLATSDYHETGDPISVVAARHGVSSSALHSWLNPKPRARRVHDEADLAYVGGWENRGGVMYPLIPGRFA